MERKNKIQTALQSLKSCFRITAFFLYSVLFCSNASYMKGGSIKETKPENKQFFFTDMCIIFTLSGITGISSHVLNHVFALLPML